MRPYGFRRTDVSLCCRECRGWRNGRHKRVTAPIDRAAKKRARRQWREEV